MKPLKTLIIPGCLIALVALILWAYEPFQSRRTLFSSNTSPSGTFIAENFLDDTGYGSGAIIVRRSLGTETHEALFPEPSADVFLKWTDDDHLSVLSEAGFARYQARLLSGAFT